MATTHFEDHVLYHDAIDRREAKERAMRAEAEDRIWCTCPELEGEDENCPLHGLAAQECTCGPNDAPACPSCRARAKNEPLPF